MAETDGLARATTAVVVTYGARSRTALEAVSAASASGAVAAVIVLNGCTVEAVEELGAASPALPVPTKLVVLPENLGSAGGFAAGVEAAARDDDSALIWLLDDDNRPIESALMDAIEMLASYERTCGVGLVAVSCARPADRFHAELLAGRSPDEVFEPPGTFLHLDLRRRIARSVSTSTADPATADLASGPYGGLLLSVPLVRRIGSPRADLVLYEDDVEYTQRIRMSGGALVFAPTALVLETDKPVGPDVASTPGPRPLLRMLRTPADEQHRLYYQYRNRVFLDRQRAVGAARIALVINAVAYLAVVSAAVVADPRNRDAAPAFAAAIRDGVRGRLGPTRPLGPPAAHS